MSRKRSGRANRRATRPSRLAAEKAAQAAARHPDSWVLAADTLVLLGEEILGKPRDDADARRMLGLLAGREHRVVTATRLARGADAGRERIETSRVRVAPLSPEEILWYVAIGEPRDKAGAYAVQGLGSRFIESVSGSYTNVMGLPARSVYLPAPGVRGRVSGAPGSQRPLTFMSYIRESATASVVGKLLAGAVRGPADGERRLHVLHAGDVRQPVAELLRLLRGDLFFGPRKKDQELVASPSEDEVRFPHARSQVVRDELQDVVARPSAPSCR